MQARVVTHAGQDRARLAQRREHQIEPREAVHEEEPQQPRGGDVEQTPDIVARGAKPGGAEQEEEERAHAWGNREAAQIVAGFEPSGPEPGRSEQGQAGRSPQGGSAAFGG